MLGRGTPAVALILAVLASGCTDLVTQVPRDHSSPHDHRGHAAAAAAHGEHSHAGHPLELRGFDPLVEPDLTETPPFPLEGGERPTLERAKSFVDQYSSFTAQGDAGLDRLRAEGHLKGNGTREAPYVLERVRVRGDLTIASTDRALILRESYIEGTLRLNYVGEELYVHHVYAKDLRINENVRRTGDNTGGLFHDNAFAIVGQIRHFTGEFRNNMIGPAPSHFMEDFLGDAGLQRIPTGVVFNFDGFHGADVHHNDFTGGVSIKLHGHNHADCFTCPVHDHANTTHFPGNATHTLEHEEAQRLGFRSHHSVRYVSLRFADNVIRVPGGVALRYHDTNHAGDDRRANSEPNPFLEDPHVHVQDVTIRNNHLDGGRLVVDVFNAPDKLHVVQNHGILRLVDNRIDVRVEQTECVCAAAQRVPVAYGIEARSLDGLELRAVGNVVRFLDRSRPLVDLGSSETELTGIRLDRARMSNLTFERNQVADATFGLFARHLNQTVHWRLVANDFAARHAWRGEQVERPPEEWP